MQAKVLVGACGGRTCIVGRAYGSFENGNTLASFSSTSPLPGAHKSRGFLYMGVSAFAFVVCTHVIRFYDRGVAEGVKTDRWLQTCRNDPHEHDLWSRRITAILNLCCSYLSRHSTSTGLASIRRIEDGTAVKVKAFESTSSPGLTPTVSRASRIAEEHELTPRAYLTPGPVPVAVKSTNSCSSWATCDVSALALLYLLSRPERSTSTTSAMLSSGTPMGSVKSLVKTGGACCWPTPGWDGFGKDVTMEKALVEQGAAKHRAASVTAVFMFEACKAMSLVVVKNGGLAWRRGREGKVIRGCGITCDGAAHD